MSKATSLKPTSAPLSTPFFISSIVLEGYRVLIRNLSPHMEIDVRCINYFVSVVTDYSFSCSVVVEVSLAFYRICFIRKPPVVVPFVSVNNQAVHHWYKW